MTETEKMIDKFLRGLGGQRYREIFDILESNNIHPLGKSNTENLLFQFRNGQSEVLDIFAFRLGLPPVISFPKSFWSIRANELSQYLSNFSYSEKPATMGPVSDSQYSAGQIEIKRTTHERIIDVCNRICESIV